MQGSIDEKLLHCNTPAFCTGSGRMSDPLTDVLRTTARVVSHAEHVQINVTGIASFCKAFQDGDISRLADQAFDTDLHYINVNDDPDGTAQALLVVDALNFCFWPTPGLEYEHLSKGVKAAMLANRDSLSAQRLSTYTVEDVAGLFLHPGPIPLLEERARLVREVGFALLQHFRGLAANMVRAAEHSAARLVSILTAHCPGFRDHCVYRGQQVFLYKRAQIFAGDLWGAFQGQGLGHFRDIHAVTMFADYRVPVVLQQQDVLRYSASLADKIGRQELLPPGSEWEVEIRAATIQAVHQIQMQLAGDAGQCDMRHGGGIPNSVQLDWFLWEQGEAQADKANKHHRTLTMYY